MMARMKLFGLVLAVLLTGAVAGNVGPALATLFTWSQTASSNSNADSSINWAEGQAPGTVNDSARAMMAAVAKFRDDLSGKLNTTGTSTAYTLTSNQTFTSLADGIQIAFRLDETNGAAPTLNVDSLGAKALRLLSATNLTGSELLAGSIYVATFDTVGDEWLVSGNIQPAQQVPAGTVADFAGTTAPTGWLLMHGQCVSRTTFAALFAILSTTYDNGCLGTEFGIPDARGRVVAGQDDMGGTSANRLTTPINGDTLGAAGGGESQTITQAQLPSVNFTVTDPSHEHPRGDATDQSFTVASGGGASLMWRSSVRTTGLAVTGITVASGGSGQGHPNVQPTLVLNKIIKQ